MLRPQICGQLNQLARLFKARKNMVFLQFLVVVLNKALDDARRRCSPPRVKFFIGLNAPEGFVIDQQHAVKYAVFAHQIFIGGNVFFCFFFFLGGLF